MTGRVSLRGYDHKAYAVCLDGAETAAFVIATFTGWELRVRPSAPTMPAGSAVAAFRRLAAVRDWLRTDAGRAWLDQTRQEA